MRYMMCVGMRLAETEAEAEVGVGVKQEWRDLRTSVS
jgi:hypothetical protein